MPMNDQYQYVGKSLTPSIARELIQELFAGQEVRKQEIVRNVNETHRERGGHPAVSRYPPVTRALSAMKQSGLAKNPRQGFWFILPHIKTLNGFLKWASQFDFGEDSEKYLFRGVSSVNYKIDASAYRRLKKGRNSDEKQDGDFERFLQINRDMIRDARFRGHGHKAGRKLEDLEILAEFQHYGAATCLMDFTHNALVALWFACKKNSKDASKDGKVVAVRPGDSTLAEFAPGFSVITLESLAKEIDDFFRDNEGNIREKLYQWQPRHQNNRITAQQSIFLFGVLEINPELKCFIDRNSKERIRESLERIYGITEDMLFPDFDGFARLYSQDVPYTLLTASQYKEHGTRAYERGEYTAAIINYDMAIDREPDNAETYYERGLANVHLDQYEAEAIADFDEAIRLNPDYAQAYYNRGVMKRRVERYEEAIADFDMAIDKNPNYSEAYDQRGVSNYFLEQYEEAITDFNVAIRLNLNRAETYYLRGAAKSHLRRYEEALIDANDVIRLDPDYADAYYLRGIVKKRIAQYLDAILDFDIVIRLDSSHVNAYYHRADAKSHLRQLVSAKADLEVALPLAEQVGNDKLIADIKYLLYEINSRTAGGSQDE